MKKKVFDFSSPGQMNVRTQSLGKGVAELLSLSAAWPTQFLLSHQRLDDFTKVGSVIRPEAVPSFCQGWANTNAKSIHERSEGKSRPHARQKPIFQERTANRAKRQKTQKWFWAAEWSGFCAHRFLSKKELRYGWTRPEPLDTRAFRPNV